MALKFSQTKGKAQKGANYYTFKDGENVLRLVGDVLPRYSYWVKDANGKDVSIECLGFDREQEKFTNVEKDWVRHHFPDLKCSWSYAVQAIDVAENKLVVVNLKKKLFEQIITTAEDLGDPTDPETGWNVCFKKTKTGPHAFNVEYTLQPLRCKPQPLTDEQRELIAEMKSIDEILPRMTADEQKKFIEEKVLASATSNGDSEVPDDFQSGSSTASDDDIPY